MRTLEFPLRSRWQEFGRRFAIETSADGTTWQTVWEDWTGGPAIAAALEDQVKVPVQLVLPDVTARYLRLHPVEEWLLEELVVKGPVESGVGIGIGARDSGSGRTPVPRQASVPSPESPVPTPRDPTLTVSCPPSTPA